MLLIKSCFSPGGYVATGEIISLAARHGVAAVFMDANAVSKKVEIIYPANLDARSGRVYYDTRRNELYLVALLPNSAINKKGPTVAKLSYAIVVTKRNTTGGLVNSNVVNMIGGETNQFDSSLSGFYDNGKDRQEISFHF